MNSVLPILTCAGLAALALGMERHHAAVSGRKPMRGGLLASRFAGWTLLLASAWYAARTQGASVGLATWTAWLAFDGFALTLLLAYLPRAFPLGTAGLALLPAAGIQLAQY